MIAGENGKLLNAYGYEYLNVYYNKPEFYDLIRVLYAWRGKYTNIR